MYKCTEIVQSISLRHVCQSLRNTYVYASRNVHECTMKIIRCITVIPSQSPFLGLVEAHWNEVVGAAGYRCYGAYESVKTVKVQIAPANRLQESARAQY